MRNDSFLHKFLYKTAIDIVEMQKYQCNVKLGFQWKMADSWSWDFSWDNFSIYSLYHWQMKFYFCSLYKNK